MIGYPECLAAWKKGETFYMVTDVNGKVVAISKINKRASGYESHVDVMGIAIKNGFRDFGIGI